MSIFITVVLFALGVLFIVKGGDLFVGAASWFAEVSGIPKLIVGATVVSFATTLPELLVSALAAAEGKVDMAIGNAVGSVTANIGLIMGISLLCMPSIIKRSDYLVKSLLMLFAAAFIVLFGYRGELPLVYSSILVLIFAAAMYDNIRTARSAMKTNAMGAMAQTSLTANKSALRMNIMRFILGTIGIVVGAQLLVNSGSELARIIGVPERIIGVTIIAIGTSLPELVTTITAILKKQAALSVGNIIGANIIDLSMILPICAFISGGALPISAQVAAIDLPFSLLVGLIAVVPMLITQKFHRAQGIFLLLTYGVYLLLTCGII